MAAKKTSKKKASSKNEVAKKEENALALPFDFSADAGSGMEGADSESFAIPFLRILQPLSPQCTPGDAEFIEEARPGMMLNSVTSELMSGKEGATFLPCSFQRRFLRWAPRSSGSGFGGEYLPEQIAQMRANGEIHEDGRDLFAFNDNGKFISEKENDRYADTRSHFGLLVTESGVSQVLLSLSSTQIKKSKQLMSILNFASINGQTPPTWMNAIKISTVLESNDQGSWYGAKFEAGGFIDSKELYDAGKKFHYAITSGEAKANYAADDDDGEEVPAEKF